MLEIKTKMKEVVLLLSGQPFYAILFSLFYVGIIHLLVRDLKKSRALGITILASLMQLTFLYFWLDKIIFLMINNNLGPKAFEDLYKFVDISYFLLFLPLFLLLAWYGFKSIARKSHSFFFKWLFIFLYLFVLIGLFLLGNFIFISLFYGFAP